MSPLEVLGYHQDPYPYLPSVILNKMPVPTSQACATCAKPCYPTEKVMVSDLWVHKNGCLKVHLALFVDAPS